MFQVVRMTRITLKPVTPKETHLSMSDLQLGAKWTAALASALIRRLFLVHLSPQHRAEARELTDEMLKEDILTPGGVESDEDAMRLIESFTAVLENGAQNRWNAREVESALAELGWPEEMQAAFVRAWRKDEGDLHAAVVRASSWTSTLSEAPAWRIDVKTKARYAGDLNEPTAIVQLAVQDAEGDGSRDVQFEMSREQVVSTLDELNKIEALIKRATQA